jgi:hypothetical protein
MKPSEKRTSTQLGLGKVTGEPRHTTKRERVEPGVSSGVSSSVSGGSAPPISAPPPSGGPTSTGRHPRHTRSLESAPPPDRGAPTLPSATPPPVTAVRTESNPPIVERVERIERIERIEIEDSPISVRGPSSSRTPIDVTHVDTKRLPRDGARAPSTSSDSREGRFGSEEKPTGRRLISPDARLARADGRADPDTMAPPPSTGSRTVDGRPIGAKRTESARPSPSSSRPNSARPSPASPASNRPSARPSTGGRTSGRPASARPSRTSAAPASPRAPSSPSPSPVFTKSQRPSIREDDVGAALKGDAVRGAGQAIPKLLMSKAEIAAAPIDHRAGFLLAHIDGVTTVAALVDICGMPEDELNEILDRLRRLGIVAVR